MASPDLVELAEDWLRAKAVGAGSATGNSERARRADLARWGRTLHLFRGDDVDHTAPLELDRDLAGLSPSDLSVDAVLEALAALRGAYRDATVRRQLSTLRTFCRWLVTRGHLAQSPCDDESVTLRAVVEPEVRAFTVADVERMLDAAGEPPPEAVSAWAARDVAVIDLLAHTGVRASEACALQVRDIVRTERPILHIQRATKSRKRREVPLPAHVVQRVDRYLADRRSRFGERPETAGSVTPTTPLLVRNDGRPFTRDALYHLVRRVALAAGASLPDDAVVHGLRHHFGLQLALRGVPPATLQQLMGHADPRTTSIYTRHASHDLVNALDDAGWL